jgi:hypothetical protein
MGCRRIAAEVRQVDVGAAGMVVDPLADVVDVAAEDDPVVAGAVVAPDLVPVVLDGVDMDAQIFRVRQREPPLKTEDDCIERGAEGPGSVVIRPAGRSSSP